MTVRRFALTLAVALPISWSAAVAAEYDPAEAAAARGAFVDRMVAEHGFGRERLESMLAEAVIVDSILEAIARPAERVVPWYEYRQIFLNDARIDAGARFWREHTVLVERTAAERGVDAPMLLAILGIETLYGERTGSYRVLDALSTLAFAYPPRSAFFTGELESFLLLAREEGEQLLDATGSYAGAMGAGQFIPSSYRAYAVDANDDGRRDLWGDWEDVLGSVANYLAVHGWRAGEPVAVPATRRADAAAAEPDNGLDLDTTVGALRAQGYEFETSLPDSAPAMAMAVLRDADTRQYWVGFNNFHVVTRYNRSIKYALAARELSRAIEAAYAGGAAAGDEAR